MLGSIVTDEKLRPKVEETISDIRKAGKIRSQDIKFWIATGDKLSNTMNIVKRTHLLKDIHMNHMIVRGEDFPSRLNSIRREIDANPRRLHYLIAEGGIIGKIR